MQQGRFQGGLLVLLLAGCAVSDPGPAVATLPADLDPALAELIEETRGASPDALKVAKAFVRLLQSRNLNPEDVLTWGGLTTELEDVEIWADLLGDAKERSVAIVIQQGADFIPGTSALRVLLFGTDGALLDRMDFQAARPEARLISAFMETEQGDALVGIGSLGGASGEPEKLDVFHRGRTVTVAPDAQEIGRKKFSWICLAEAREGRLQLLFPDRK
jgi:hypothetical protein